jgi:bacillopeptidase F (M6 metalloprotease family)
VQVNGAAVATISDANPAGSWFSTSVDLSSHAGQTITLAFAATNGTKLPTAFWVDDVSVLA